MPANPVTVLVNTNGMGVIAVGENGGDPVFETEYSITSAFQNVEKGSEVKIACKADEDWMFYKWTKNGEFYSKDENITVTADEDAEYIAYFAMTSGYEGEAVSDINDAKTLSDVLALPCLEAAFTEEKYVYVFELDGIAYRAIAALSPETSKALFDLDFEDPDRDKKECDLVASLPIEQLDNLTAHIPTEEKMKQYVGKTGAELLEEGWNLSGYNLEDMIFTMSHGAYEFEVQFEGKVENPSEFDEEKDMKDLTAKSFKYSRLGNASDLEAPLD